jgi:hypothetical protein
MDETLTCISIVVKFGREKFQYNVAVEGSVVGFVNYSHTALTKLFTIL